ncbi:TPA: hypothetical protein F8A23_08740 [Legionella pneumophila]|uniref:terminase small subunit-like protein n=1 Tax=Legionella sp. PATHC039 TaxID=2992042 RepID=UPI001A1BCCA2|nr:hypothetical protein [Legionella sp. PATHC039]BCL64456.1 hypothetical protein [Legionella pneumophila serogroup 7]HAT8858971.1 hypothetical protein [Legionella pneumophila subsp. pneumophila]HAU1397741.1 hypothetical protein [Legionella pneumophila]MCW8395576.1 hypothetical protein [Legionella sp. PATHC039]HAT9650704.1 hypothetical protein [Legionella pneumophila subsp. pneumophila]
MTEVSVKKGRPTKYNDTLAREICDTIASSSKGTKKLCFEHPHWPCQDTLFAWLKAYPEFSEQYAQAKRCQVELLIDEILEISDDVSQDQYTNEVGALVPNPPAISRARLKIDTRKWLACKLVPKVYGNKIEIESDSRMSEELRKLSADLDAKYTREY